MAKRKRPKKRKGIPRPHASGTMTEAGKHGFIVGALRKAHMKWRPKHEAIERAFVEDGPNPETGRPCKLHRCASCKGLRSKGDMRADHLRPVVNPHVGFVSWDKFIERMFVEVEHYRAICVDCHKEKTAEEREIRKELLGSAKAS